jgi:hypothetical protein
MIKIQPIIKLQVRVEQIQEEADRAYRQVHALMVRSLALKSIAEDLLKEIKRETDRSAKRN